MMDLLCNPHRKGLLAVNMNDTIKFMHLNVSPSASNGALTKNDFSLSPATMPDLPEHVDSYNVNCMAWCSYGQSASPDSLAVGLENGSVYIAWPKYSELPSNTNTILLHQASKSCKSLAWNKLRPEYLALGFDRCRSECSLIITNLHERQKREHVSGLLDNKIKGQTTDSCFGDAVNSVMWTYRDPNTLVAGVNGKCLRLYDMRSIRTPTQVVNTKYVLGLCQDPCLDSRFASFADNQINIWDMRSFSKPAAAISTKHTVLKADWCPTRNGLLATLSSGSKDGDIVRVYDTSHTVVTDSDSDIAYRHVEQLLRLPLNPGEKIGAISWLTDEENELVAITNSGTVHHAMVPERISVSWTNQSELVSASKHIRHCFKKHKFVSDALSLPGIEQIMFKRSKNGYGLDEAKDHSSSEINLEPNNASLSLFWKWIKIAKESFPISVTKDMKPNFSHGGRPPWLRSSSSNSVLNSRFCGLQKELKQTSSNCRSVPWNRVPNSACTVYSSPHRSRALSMCGWFDIDKLRKDPSEFRVSLLGINEIERAAILALWHLDMELAIDILKQHGSGDSAVRYSVIAMALSGYIGNNAAPLWKEMCDSLQRNMPSAYLRAAFSFLKALKEPKIDFRDILKMKELSVSDRIGFACTYLNDEALGEVMDELSDDAAKNGLLDGIIATGLTTDLGIELLQCYIEKTKDVQTAALGLIQGGLSGIIQNQTAAFIIEGYRKLLDLWQLWKERAWFDTVFGKLNSSQKSKQAFLGVSVQCNFCGKAINHAKLPDIRGRGMMIQGSANSSKPISCPKCRKPLPRCSICCMGLGTTQGDSQDDRICGDGAIMENSFTWCPFCQHGGHRLHLKEWFREHSDCPVSGCSCDCKDSQSLT